MARDLLLYLPAVAVSFRRFSPSDGLFTDCRRDLLQDSDVDFEVSGGSGHDPPNVLPGAEVQPAVSESRGQGLGDEKPGAAVPRGDGGGVIEERPGVEDLEDFRVSRTASRSGSGSSPRARDS
jgi:hypothetical protein